MKIKDGSYEIDAYQSAIKANDTIEISGAVARGIPVFERAQAWGEIMDEYLH